MVKNTGDVLLCPSIHALLLNAYDFTYFPFDKELIYLHVSSWTVPTEQMKLNLEGNLTFLRSNIHWEVVHIDAFEHDDPWANTSYEGLVFMILVKRNSQFYVFNMIFPACLLSILSVLILFMPPSSGDRMSLPLQSCWRTQCCS